MAFLLFFCDKIGQLVCLGVKPAWRKQKEKKKEKKIFKLKTFDITMSTYLS